MQGNHSLSKECPLPYASLQRAGLPQQQREQVLLIFRLTLWEFSLDI